MRISTTAGFALIVASLAACQPALNWREVRPSGSGLVVQFPCKPDVDQRKDKGLAQCEAAGQGFAVSWAEVPDATQVAAALKAMPQALAGKLGVVLAPAGTLVVPGMTPMPEAGQYRLAATTGVTRVAVFAHGARVYQVLMTAQKDDESTWESFRGGLSVEVAR